MAYEDRTMLREKSRHMITLEGRRKLSVTGVSESGEL
jgi:hypothetical protein